MFQCPEGHCLLSYSPTSATWAAPPPRRCCFSAPKGIVCFPNPWMHYHNRLSLAWEFQCPEGHCLLSYLSIDIGELLEKRPELFQCPEGHCLLSYQYADCTDEEVRQQVSVPRRALSSFLHRQLDHLGTPNPSFSAPKGIVFFPTHSMSGNRRCLTNFSAPQGIVFSSTWQISNQRQNARGCCTRFSAPKGIVFFATDGEKSTTPSASCPIRFSAPKSIVFFATQMSPLRCLRRVLFQCPEGHCLLCYWIGSINQYPAPVSFQRPEGHYLLCYKLPAPNYGLAFWVTVGFSAPKGIVFFATC